jgi:hypothetical protein
MEEIKKEQEHFICIECNRKPFNIFCVTVKDDQYCIECLLQHVQKEARKKRLPKCCIRFYYYEKDLMSILEKFDEKRKEMAKSEYEEKEESDGKCFIKE